MPHECIHATWMVYIMAIIRTKCNLSFVMQLNQNIYITRSCCNYSRLIELCSMNIKPYSMFRLQMICRSNWSVLRLKSEATTLKKGSANLMYLTLIHWTKELVTSPKNLLLVIEVTKTHEFVTLAFVTTTTHESVEFAFVTTTTHMN